MSRESDYSVALTPCELEVLQMACNGYSNKKIAETLFVTIKTVEHHMHSAHKKLGCSTQRELVARAHELLLVLPASPIPHLEELLARTKSLSQELEQAIAKLKEVYKV